MDTAKTIQYWLAGSERAREVMEALYEKEKYPESLFFGHLALEKLLKATVVAVTHEHAPYTHDLRVLAKKANLEINPEQEQFFKDMTKYNLETRYPDELKRLYKELDREKATAYIKQLKSFHSWLKKKLQS